MQQDWNASTVLQRPIRLAARNRVCDALLERTARVSGERCACTAPPERQHPRIKSAVCNAQVAVRAVSATLVAGLATLVTFLLMATNVFYAVQEGILLRGLRVASRVKQGHLRPSDQRSARLATLEDTLLLSRGRAYSAYLEHIHWHSPIYAAFAKKGRYREVARRLATFALLGSSPTPRRLTSACLVQLEALVPREPALAWRFALLVLMGSSEAVSASIALPERFRRKGHQDVSCVQRESSAKTRRDRVRSAPAERSLERGHLFALLAMQAFTQRRTRARVPSVLEALYLLKKERGASSVLLGATLSLET